ncbi:MAG: rRNA maturation RNase YbeY [Patescibacteria group bacterium]|jgi:probable rRNA maturation factor
MKVEIIGKGGLENKEIVEFIDDISKKIGIATTDAILEIVFVSEDEIRKLNSTFRKINKETDVLSFPQISINGNIPIFGSIVICEKIGKDRGETTEELLSHGFLHLTGYDHETNQSKWDEIEAKIT